MSTKLNFQAIASTLYRALNVIVILGMMLSAAVNVEAFTYTVPPDATPGSPVTIHGDNSDGLGQYIPDAAILVKAYGPTVAEPLVPWYGECTAVVAADGTWSCVVTLSSDPLIAVGSYTYDVYQSGAFVESGTFTDGDVLTYQQCSNDDGDGYSGNPGVCHWINGNMQKNNSTIYEHDATVQRLWLQGLANGPHTITLKYGTTKGGKHAYDYLTTWNHSEDWISPTDLCNGVAACISGFATADTLAIPHDPSLTGTHTEPAGQVFTMWGGDMTSASTPAIVSGDYLHDSETAIQISFTTSGCPAKGCEAVLWFGAHVSSSIVWAPELTAIDISGSPYHVALVELDGGAIGSRDNQMQTEAIVPLATIVIVKDAIPDDAQDFPFSLIGVGNPVNESFSLDNDADPTLSNTKSFTVSAGTYNAAETPVTGWNLTSVVCVNTVGTTSTWSDISNGKQILLKAGETVTCTFTNTLGKGHIIVDKVTDPSGSPQSFEFDPSWSTTNFFLTDADTPVDSGELMPGTYSVAEVSIPTGWDLATPVCSDGSPVTAIDLQPFETVTCTFTNTQRGTIIVEKQTVPDGATASFNFTGTAAGTISDNGQIVVSNLVPGTYSSTEAALANWNLTGIVCDDGSSTTPSTVDLVTRTATFKLDPGEVVKCTFTNALHYADLTVTKTATPAFGRLYNWLIDKSVDKTTINIADGGKATFGYSVKVTPDGYTDSGWVVNGEITVTNPNPIAFTGVNVSDAIDNGGACTVTGGTNVTVPANDHVHLAYSCTYAAAPSPAAGTNTATTTWDKAAFFTPNGSANGTAGVDFAAATPSETNKVITVIDDKTNPGSPVTLGTWDWADGAHTFTYSLDKTGVAGTCTDYTNTAKISETGQSDNQKVTVCVGKDLTVTKTAAGTFNRTYLWQISKDVDQTLVKIAEGGSYTFHYTVGVAQTGITDAGWTLSGVITISNPNDWEAITLTSLTDVVDNGGVCVVDPGPYVVAKSDSLDVNYTCAYASVPSSYSGTNTATATWDKAAYFTPNGTANGTAGFTLSQLGSTNKTIHVTDSYGGNLGSVTATDAAPFATASFTYDRTESGVAGTCTKYDNTATITETSQTADKSVTLCVGKDLTVSKTAAGTFNRTYLWQISKAVDETQINIAWGDTAEFTYTVNVAQTGISDAGWTLSGKITINNPNDWEDITLISLADAVDNGGSCTVDPGPYTIAKSGSIEVNYSCSYASAPTSYSGTNTATATWDKAAYFTPNGTASGTKTFTLSQLGSTNKTVTITDTLGGALGTVTATDGAPFTTATFTYSKSFPGIAGSCKTYDNTATITETGQYASKTVKVCTGLDLTLTKTAAGTFDRTYLWQISKAADKTSVNIAAGGSYTFPYTVDVAQTGFSDAGWTLSGKITISNPNDWEDITLTGLADVVTNGGVCTVAPGTYIIPKSGSLDVNYTCAYASAPTSYSGTNTATATWDKAVAFTPGNTASGSKTFTLAQLGSTNKTVTITDSYGGNLGTVTAMDSAPFATASFTYDRTESGVAGTCTEYDNTATITETNQTASKTVTLCVARDLTVSKTAAGTFDRLYKWLIDKSVDDTQINIAEGGKATFNYLVAVTPNGYTDSGWTLAGKITVTNPNDWEAITADVTDVFAGGGTCTVTDGTGVVIPADQSVTLDYSCTFSSKPAYTGTNTATATWDAATYFTPSGSATGTADVTLTLTGETNRVITVTDDKTTGTPVPLGTSDYYVGPFEFTYSLDKPGVAGTCTDYTNTAVIDETDQSDSQKVTVCVGKDLTVTKTANGTKDRLYKWLIDKSVDKTTINIAEGGTATFNYSVKVTPDGFTDSNWTLGGTITIDNPNDWEDVTVSVADTLDLGGTCTITEAAPYIVRKSGSLTLHYTCATDGTSTKNTATVTWDKAAFFTPNASAFAEAAVTFDIDVETNKTITVIDDKTDPLHPVTLGTSNYNTGPFEFTYSLSKPGVAGKCTDYTNIAKINETGQSDNQKVTVCVGKDLTVTKTAAAHFDREYLWKITKSVDPSSYSGLVGDVAHFVYTVVAEQTGVLDSGWTLAGEITVSNPNEWEAITATVTDAYPGGVCTVTGGTAVSITAKGQVVLPYSCTFSSKPAYTGINTATATWDKTAAATPNGSATGTAAVTFTLDQKFNQVVDVTDSFKGVLGTLTGTDAIPWAKATYTYSRDIDVMFACQYYDNTARIYNQAVPPVELAKDSASVSVCGKYWSFTPGFWKNHTPDEKNGHNAWAFTAYHTGDLVGVIFDPTNLTDKPRGGTATFAQLSLLQALSLKGGPDLSGAIETLLRAGVAALLNASFLEVGGQSGAYPLTVQGVKDAVNTALATKDRQTILNLAAELDGYNNGTHTIDWSWTPGAPLP